MSFKKVKLNKNTHNRAHYSVRNFYSKMDPENLQERLKIIRSILSLFARSMHCWEKDGSTEFNAIHLQSPGCKIVKD